MGQERLMKTAEGYRAVEVILQCFDHALAGERPVAGPQNPTNRPQTQRPEAYYAKPTPSPEMKSPLLHGGGRVDDRCVTFGRFAPASSGRVCLRWRRSF